MPPLEKYTKCDLLKDRPWYINLKQKEAKKVYVGKKKAIYYKTYLKNGRTRKNYIQQPCRRVGTTRFWNKIAEMKQRYFSRKKINARGKVKKHSKKKRKKYRI